MELQSPETMKLFGNTKKLVQFNLVDNQYYQRYDILQTSLRKAQQIIVMFTDRNDNCSLTNRDGPLFYRTKDKKIHQRI